MSHDLRTERSVPTPEEPNTGDRLLRLGLWWLSVFGTWTQRQVLSRAFDRIHRSSDPWSYSVSPYEQRRFDAALAAPGEGPFNRCLDAACSDGVFTERLVADTRFGHVRGIDVSRRAIERAAARIGDRRDATFASGNVLDGSSLGGPWDLIYCMEVLYYLGRGTPRAARNLVDVLAPGGRIVAIHLIPEALHLHRTFESDARLVLVTRSVLDDPARPLRVDVFERTRRASS